MTYKINTFRRAENKPSGPWSWSATVKLYNPFRSKRIRRDTAFFNKKEVQAAAAKEIAEIIRQDEAGVVVQVKLHDALQIYLRNHSEIRVNSWKDHELCVNRLSGKVKGHDGLRNVLVSQITQGDLSALVAARKKAGLSASTINKELVLLSAAFKWLALNEQIEVPSKINFGQLKMKPFTKKRWATPQQLASILARIPEGIERDIAVLLMSTGARLGEIRCLRWDQVRLNEGFIDLERTKVDNEGRLQLSEMATEVMTKRYNNRQPDDVYVFQTHKRSFPQPYGRPRLIDTAIELSGINNDQQLVKKKGKFTIHSMRDSFVSILAQSGEHSLSEIQQLLGHATTHMTAKYEHLVPSDVARKAAATMNAQLGGIISGT